MASHGDPLLCIQAELLRIEDKRTRIDREIDRLLAQRAHPSVDLHVRKNIRSRLGALTRNRSRLDQEEAELRRRESNLRRIYEDRHPAGSPASSSREIGVEEHAGEVSNSELGGTSTDLSDFRALMLNDDTSYTLESTNRVDEHAGKVRNSELGGTSMDLSECEALMLNDDTSYTLESADRLGEHACKVRSSEPADTSTDLSKFEALTVNDTPHVPESADKVEEHASEVSNSNLGGTNTDLSEFGALILNDDPSYTVASADRVEEHDGEVRSSEPAGASMDMSEFEALTLNDTSHIPESADRVVVHVDTVGSGMLDSTIAEPSALERKPSQIAEKYWPPKNQGDISFAERQAEKEYAESQAQLLQARGQYTYVSKEEIARNANKWMSEEVMVAFRRYIGSEDDLKDIEYEFEELLDQCFNVEHYFKIFHHFNFRVKIRKCGSSDWIPMTFFAEVISILETKHYVCYPLDPDENGHCYACRNQGVFKLRHPSADIFDRGNEDTTFPYYYEDSDSDESHPVVGRIESDDDMS